MARSASASTRARRRRSGSNTRSSRARSRTFAAHRPVVGTEDELVTLTCRKRLFATDLTDTVLQSRTPSVRGAASPVDEVVFDDGILRVIKAKVATAGSPKKFLRLEVTGN